MTLDVNVSVTRYLSLCLSPPTASQQGLTSGWVDVVDVMEVNGLRPSWYQIDDSSPFPPILDFLIGSCLKKKVQLFNKACVAKSTG